MQSRGGQSAGGNYKYNNLKIYFEPSRYSEPHFIVTIGISSAAFNLESGEKISGGLAGDEKYIARWLSRSSAKEELKAALSEEKNDNKVVGNN